MASSRGPRLAGVGVVLSLAASGVCFWLWYAFYLRLPFDAQGRFHDPRSQTVHTDAGFAWGLPAGGFLVGALATVGWRWRRRRGRRPPAMPGPIPPPRRGA